MRVCVYLCMLTCIVHTHTSDFFSFLNNAFPCLSSFVINAHKQLCDVLPLPSVPTCFKTEIYIKKKNEIICACRSFFVCDMHCTRGYWPEVH